MTEFNLSERIMFLDEEKGFAEEDVKEFIRLLKEGPEEDVELTIKRLHKWIDKLAGERFVLSQQGEQK